jgi:hypothetical protein
MMTGDGQTNEVGQAQRALTLTLAGILGGVGCLTVVIVLVAIGAGLWLDNQFNTRPLFTLGLVLGSVPLTIYLMVRIILKFAPRITEQTGKSAGHSLQEAPRGGERRIEDIT